MVEKNRLKGVYEKKGNLLTKNLVPGVRVYDEQMINEKGEEYRTWNARKSKLAAAIKMKVSQIGIKPATTVLYLGASTGTTVSHVSDIIGEEGFVFALEFSARVTRELVFVSESRPNIAPILADANDPESYKRRVCAADCIYQDIAQKNQVEIFKKNIFSFLEPGGFGILCVKARSIDVTKKPKAVFSEVRSELEKDLKIVDYRDISEYQKDHCVFVVKS